VARARIDRAAHGGVRTSLLSAGGLTGVEVAGFDVVGEVLGTAVLQIGWKGYRGCGWNGVNSPGSGSRGYEPFAQALRDGRRTALDRMVQEAAALGADGVVGVRLTDDPMDGQKREFMALGTAVRSRGRQRPAKPFTTDLGGQDLAKLLTAGWVPAGIVYGIAVSIRHDDWRTQRQTSVFAGNTEVSGYTRLLTDVRASARRHFTEHAARHGAEVALMTDLWSKVWPLEVGENHTDHVAECVVVGNAIAPFRPGQAPTTNSLTILPLRSPR